MRKFMIAASLVAALFPSVSVHACGESMFRVGFGMEIPAGSVKQPARIVIYRASDSSPDVFFDDARVTAKLDKAGHHVTRVAAETASSVPADIDVVIARADEIDRARATLSAQLVKAVYLPVTEGFAKAGGSADLSLSANATLRQILGVLQRALQSGID